MVKSIEQSRILFLDSGPLVRLLQMHPDYYPVVSGVLDNVYENNVQVLVSSVTLFEICKRRSVQTMACLQGSTASFSKSLQMCAFAK